MPQAELLVRRVVVSLLATTMAAAAFAPIAAADATTHLKSEIDAARSESGCAPLQLDPVLNDVSQRISRETDDYVRHSATFLPTTGEIDLLSTGSGGMLKVMNEAGYHTSKARLLSGYGDHRVGGTGDNEAKAIKATVLQGLGFEALNDCGYTKYGLGIINDNKTDQGWPSTAPRTYTVSTVILAAASGTQ